MEAELDQVDGRAIIGPERRLECLIASNSVLEEFWLYAQMATYVSRVRPLVGSKWYSDGAEWP